MNKSNLSALAISATLALSACQKAPNRPAASINTTQTKPDQSTSLATAKTKLFTPAPEAPKSKVDFYVNMLSCEATVNAHRGYIQSVITRLNVTELNLGTAPCEIVFDVKSNIDRIHEKCLKVIKPTGTLYFEDISEPEHKTMERIISQAKDASQEAQALSQKIPKERKDCFDPSTTAAPLLVYNPVK